MQARSSPSTKLQIASLQGPLVPGHSGAPVVDQDGSVVAIANGGLQKGTVGFGWAIPYAAVKFTPSGASTRVREIASRESDSLFRYETIVDTPPIAPIVSKRDLENRLRYVLDGVGMFTWPNGGFPNVSHSEQRSLKNLSGCKTRFSARQSTQYMLLDTDNQIVEDDFEYSFDFKKVSFTKRKLVIEGVSIGPRLRNGSPLLTISSEPGFKAITMHKQTRRFGGAPGFAGSSPAEQNQVTSVSLFYQLESALDRALEAFVTVQRSCLSVQ